MKFKATGLALATVLVGCSGGDAPFGEPVEEVVEETVPDETIESDRVVPPGTASPQPSTTIFRKEPQTADGNGFATGISFDAENDTFTVDNLPFDGGADTPYVRGDAVASFGDYAVYEAAEQYPDTATGANINQLRHRAIYGVSPSGSTEFAIIRAGSYVNYGFGGFVYERNGTVTLPTEGQAVFRGQGAGLRDYEGRGGLEYSTADVTIAIDFDDFNEDTSQFEGAVRGSLFNRRIYDLSGNEITDDILARINEGSDASLTAIPTAVFVITTNALDANGEILGAVTSQFSNNSGEAVQFETGQYYGILSGDDAGEVVGVIVTESTVDPTATSVRDTTGFAILRDTVATE